MVKVQKYALVTGGSRGIGRSICCQLAEDFDHHILINYNSNEKAALETLSLIEAKGGNASLIKFDVSNNKEVHDAIDNWQNQNPNVIIEILVNNAGMASDNLMVFMTYDEWQRVLNVNLNGFFNVTQKLLQPMLLNRYGRIINIVSISGLKGNAGQTNYSAAKGAVIAATKSLSQEVAKRNITVNAVAAGFVKTDMTQHLNENELKKTVPMNRFAEPEEIAHLVSFLASNKSSYITGETININGGIFS